MRYESEHLASAQIDWVSHIENRAESDLDRLALQSLPFQLAEAVASLVIRGALKPTVRIWIALLRRPETTQSLCESLAVHHHDVALALQLNTDDQRVWRFSGQSLGDPISSRVHPRSHFHVFTPFGLHRAKAWVTKRNDSWFDRVLLIDQIPDESRAYTLARIVGCGAIHNRVDALLVLLARHAEFGIGENARMRLVPETTLRTQIHKAEEMGLVATRPYMLNQEKTSFRLTRDGALRVAAIISSIESVLPQVEAAPPPSHPFLLDTSYLIPEDREAVTAGKLPRPEGWDSYWSEVRERA